MRYFFIIKSYIVTASPIHPNKGGVEAAWKR